MRVEDLLIYGKKNIHSAHAKILLAELLNLNPLELLNNLNKQVELQTEKKYKEMVTSIKEGKPLQYTLGYVNFYGNKFEINNNVLIPRFETEELIEQTLILVNKHFQKPIKILDIGCGSGVIGLTLKDKLPTSSVDLIDISEKALEIANNNAQNLGKEVKIYQSDAFSNVEKTYDLIISNPPYIKTTEEIEDIVKENEPHLALYAGIDGLDCYKKILKDIKKHLNRESIIAFEIGYQQANDIKEIVNKELPLSTVIVKKDLQEKDRMLFILNNVE